MAKRPKKLRARKPNREIYQIEVNDWDVTYGFLARTKSDFYGNAAYGENANIMIFGDGAL